MTMEQLGLYCFLFLLGLGALGILIAVIKTVFKGLVVTLVISTVLACGWLSIKGLEMFGVIDNDVSVVKETQKLETSIKDKFNE